MLQLELVKRCRISNPANFDVLLIDKLAAHFLGQLNDERKVFDSLVDGLNRGLDNVRKGLKNMKTALKI